MNNGYRKVIHKTDSSFYLHIPSRHTNEAVKYKCPHLCGTNILVFAEKNDRYQCLKRFNDNRVQTKKDFGIKQQAFLK